MHILFIQTGGTIDKDYPRTTQGYAFEITTPAIERILPRIAPNFEYEVLSVLRKDSQEITSEDRQKIVDACIATPINKIVITHGTDTMIETAEALAVITGKTIVITGSMRPEKFADSDAPFNIGAAVGSLDVLDEGVYITMNGRVHSWGAIKRDYTTGQFVEK